MPSGVSPPKGYNTTVGILEHVPTPCQEKRNTFRRPARAVGWQRLVVFAQPTVLAEPAEGPFHNPAFGQNNEAMRVMAFNHLNHPCECLLSPIHKRPGISGVDPDSFQPPKPAKRSLCTHALTAFLNSHLARAEFVIPGALHNERGYHQYHHGDPEGSVLPDNQTYRNDH